MANDSKKAPCRRGEHSASPALGWWQLAGAALNIAEMCGRATYKLTWKDIVALYRLTLDQAPVNTRARYNVCPTTTVDIGESAPGFSDRLRCN